MHKFFKGLARAFRCQAQTSSPSASTRSTSTAAAQQDGVDDSATGGCSGAAPGALGWHVEKAYISNTPHLLRAWRVDQGGRAGGSGVVENVGARSPASGDQTQCAWLSLPPARMRRIESIKDLAVGELRAYFSTVADATSGDDRTSAMSSARRWFFAAACQWLTDHPRPAVSAGHCVLPSSLSTASASHGTAAAATPPARLILSSDVRHSDYKQPRSGMASLPHAAVRSAVGAAVLPSSLAADERTRDAILPTSAADGRLRAAALPAESSAAADAQAGALADTIDDKVVPKGRVKAENLLDASVRQLLELIETGQGGNTSSRRRHPRSKESPLASWPEGEQERARATSPFQQSLPGFAIGGEAQLRSPTTGAASINPAASFNLGLCYEHGWGVPMNKNQAAELYRRASELGHMASCYNLAQLYLSGAVAAAGRPAPDEARRLMERAAAGNLVEAQTWLGAISFEEGNYGTAFKMFEKAAKQNCALAQYYLGVCYENGFGVNASMEAAAAQYKEAAAGGIADAQYNLGVFFQEGLGGLSRDLALARDMFAQASQSSHAPVGNKQYVLQQRSGFSSSSKLVVQDSDRRVAGHAQASSSAVGKSASLPSFTCRLGELSATGERSSIRGRCSGPAAAGLQTRGDRGHGAVDRGGRDASPDSSGCGSPVTQPATPPSTDDSAIGRSSGEPLFYIGDECDLGDSGDSTSESDELTEWSDDSGHLSPVGCELLPADAFGESLSNPYFGSSLMG